MGNRNIINIKRNVTNFGEIQNKNQNKINNGNNNKEITIINNINIMNYIPKTSGRNINLYKKEPNKVRQIPKVKNMHKNISEVEYGNNQCNQTALVKK